VPRVAKPTRPPLVWSVLESVRAREAHGVIRVTVHASCLEARKRFPEWSGEGAPSQCGSQRLARGAALTRATIMETLARTGTCVSSHDLAPRVPARPEEVTIMQSTYGSDPKGATP
jgi:hypothetical protein